MANQDIRQEITENNLRYWQVADKIGLSDGTFSRLLRHELPPEKKEEIRSAIAELKEGVQ